MIKINDIYNMDCLDGMKMIKDNSIDLIVTSPPYIDMRDYNHKEGTIKPSDYIEWLRPKVKEMLRILSPQGSFVLNLNDKPQNKIRNPWIFYTITMIIDEGFLLYDTVIWDKLKSFIMPDKSRMSDQFEYLFWFVKTRNYKISFPEEVKIPVSEATIKRRKTPCHDKDMSNLPTVKIPSTILKISSVTKFKEHKASFPEELPKFFIYCCSKEEDTILDPFMGSGTTAVASKKINRNYIGFELNQEYCNIAKKRVTNIK